jgi:hypothetical protein
VDLARALTELWRRKLWLVLGLLLAISAAVTTVYDVDVSSFPPKTEKKTLVFGTATTRLLVDAPRSPIGNLDAEFGPLTARAGIYAKLVDSVPVKKRVAERMGLPMDAIITSGVPPTSDSTRGRETSAGARAQELVGEGGGYRLNAGSAEGLPFVALQAQAPTAQEAEELANAGAEALREYVVKFQRDQNVPAESRARIKQPGLATGVLVNPTVDRQMMVLAFVGLFGAWCMLILLIVHLRESQRERRASEALQARLVEEGLSDPPSANGTTTAEERTLVHP